MSGKILILGGYGNFGGRIATALVKQGVAVIIAGRNRDKAERFAILLPPALVSIAIFDVYNELAGQLDRLRPIVVVNTRGPFQTSNYDVARVCIAHGVHYIDLADGREFVAGISALDDEARRASVAVISGASTVPGLSSAVVEEYAHEFSSIDSMVYGISPGQRSERGLATTQGILSYVGKKLKPCAGSTKPQYGWQNLYLQDYPELGKRWMSNCDIPDLDLLPARYGIRSIRFSAGLELGSMHLGLWVLSWLVRVGLPLNLPHHAQRLLSLSNCFDHFGTANGGMHVVLRGKDKSGKPYERRWFIIAKNGDGPQIPTIPAIIFARRLANNELDLRGAMPCVGLVSLEEYINQLQGFAITTHAEAYG